MKRKFPDELKRFDPGPATEETPDETPGTEETATEEGGGEAD